MYTTHIAPWLASCVRVFLVLAIAMSVAASDSPYQKPPPIENQAKLSTELSWIRREATWPVAITMGLSRLYEVPVHYEQTLQAANGRPLDLPPRSGYAIQSGDTLQEALDGLAALWPAELTWRSTGTRSAVVTAEPMDPAQDLLATRISLAIENASIWEALRSIAAKILEARQDARQLDISLPGLSKGYHPPEFLLERGAIPAFSMENIEARDAIARVLEFAPGTLRYSYFVTRESDTTVPYIVLHEYPGFQSASQIKTPEARRLSSTDLEVWNERSKIIRLRSEGTE